MTKNNTQRALVMSMVSLLLCVSMLLGTTFAWFTDSASTGINSIVAGNLDIKLSYMNADAETYTEVSADTTDLFVGDEGEAILWEPGATAICYFMLENLGSLDLKYIMSVNYQDVVTYRNPETNELVKLSNALKSVIVELSEGQTLTNDEAIIAANTDGATIALGYEDKDYVSMESGEAAKYFAMVIHMPAETGNTYNLPTGVPALKIDLGIKLEATQLNSEHDSYGPDYDKNAPDLILLNGVVYDTLDEALNAAVDGDVIELGVGTYVLYPSYAAMRNKSITIKGGKGAVIDNSAQVGVNGVQDLIGTTITFDGVTVKWSEANEGYQGLKNPSKVVYKNCDIYGTQFMYCGADFVNCTFYTGNSYAVYTRSNGDYTFTDCTFYTGGRAIMMYHDAAITVNLTATNCKFYDDGTYSSKDKAAIETGNGGSASTYTITINNCTTEGFELNNSTSALWGNKDNMDADHLSVVVDGVAQELYTWVKEGLSVDDAGTYYVNSANGLTNFAAAVNSNEISFKNTTIVLSTDIDLTGTEWTPINGWGGVLSGTVIDGRNHTIKGMNVAATNNAGFIGSNSSNVTLKNLVFDGAYVQNQANTSSNYAGVVIGYNYAANTIENVTVKNSTVISNWQCGGLVGINSEYPMTFIGCTVQDSFVGGYNCTAGAIYGTGAVDVTLTDCTAKNVNLYTDTVIPAYGPLVGYTYGYTATLNNCTADNVVVVNDYV